MKTTRSLASCMDPAEFLNELGIRTCSLLDRLVKSPATKGYGKFRELCTNLKAIDLHVDTIQQVTSAIARDVANGGMPEKCQRQTHGPDCVGQSLRSEWSACHVSLTRGWGKADEFTLTVNYGLRFVD